MRQKRELAENVWYGVDGDKCRRALVQTVAGVITVSSAAVFYARAVADLASNAPSTTKGCACFGRLIGWDENDGQERDSGFHILQTVMGLSPVGGKRGKGREFTQMYLFRLIPEE
jgi:hypothetical protein